MFDFCINKLFVLNYVQVLIVSPQNIDDFILKILCDMRLRHLHIVQNENTPKTVLACSVAAWSSFRKQTINTTLVHLAFDMTFSRCYENLIIQPCAPVFSVTCNMNKINVSITYLKMFFAL